MDYEWTRTLEQFVKGRLRNRSRTGVPLSLNGSQFVIDGIVMAINDKVDLHKASWTAVKNTLVSRWQALEGETRDVDSAAVDLYLSWCVVDAVCKGAISAELHAEIMGDLPTIVCSYLPLWEANDDDNRARKLSRVCEEHGSWYWDMLRSWRVYKMFPESTWKQVEEALASKLAALSAAQDEDDTVVTGVPVTPGIPQEGTKRQRRARGHEAVMSALQDLYAGGEVCVYCGAKFMTKEALENHHDFHVDLMRSSEGIITRLINPKLEAFLGYGGGHGDGRYASVHDLAENVTKRQHFRVTLAQKRDRELVYVDDVAEDAACEICHEQFAVASDPAGGRKYFDGAVIYYHKGTSTTVHAICLVS